MLKRNKRSQALVFVPDSKQASKLAIDLVNMSEDEHLFKGTSKLTQSDTESFSDEERELLQFGVARLSSSNQVAAVKKLFKQNKIRVIIAPSSSCWELSDIQAEVVILQDTKVYHSEHRQYKDMPFTQILQIQSLAVSKEGMAKLSILCHSSVKDFLSKYIQEPLTLESLLPKDLHPHLNAAVAASQVTNIQDALDWLTWTFMYRRILKNPNFYEIAGRSADHINDFLSELVEDTVSDLNEVGCVAVAENEMDLATTNLGRIASFYGLKFETVQAFATNLIGR